MNVVRSSFKPEFLNRLDDVVMFEPLTTEDLEQIVDLQVSLLAERLVDRRLTLVVTDAAKEWLSLTGYDPVYGARPLRRLVQTAIGDQLARSILAGDVKDGDTVLVERTHGDGLSVSSVSPERAQAAAGRVTEASTDEPEIVDAELVDD